MLHHQVQTRVSLLPKLPPKTWSITSAGKEDAFIERRRAGLQEYLRAMLAEERGARNPYLLLFLGCFGDPVHHCPAFSGSVHQCPSLSSIWLTPPPPPPSPRFCGRCIGEAGRASSSRRGRSRSWSRSRRPRTSAR